VVPAFLDNPETPDLNKPLGRIHFIYAMIKKEAFIRLWCVYQCPRWGHHE
jgi:hypothetical protein